MKQNFYGLVKKELVGNMKEKIDRIMKGEKHKEIENLQ